MADAALAIPQCGNEASLNGTLKGSLQTFYSAKKVECLDIFGVRLQPGLGQDSGLFCQRVELGNRLRVTLVFSLRLDTSGVVKRSLQAARFIQRFRPQCYSKKLGARRMRGKQPNHLLEVATGAVGVEVKKGVESFRAKLVKAWVGALNRYNG